MNSLVAPAWLPGLYAPQGVEIVQCKCVCVFVYMSVSVRMYEYVFEHWNEQAQ